MDDMTVVEDVDALRQSERRGQILFDQDDGLPVPRKLTACMHKVLDDDRGQSLERLVKQDDLGITDQRPRDRQHLLLAAGKIGAAAGAALLESGEHPVDALKRPFVLGGQSREDDILFNTKAAENTPILVHELHAKARDAMGLLRDEFTALELDAAGPPRDDAHQALQRRALASAVPADKSHRLVFLNPQRDVEEDVAVAVVGVKSFDF